MGLAKGLQCGVGMQLVDGEQLFVGQWAAEQWIEVAVHCGVGMQLCFDCVRNVNLWLCSGGGSCNGAIFICKGSCNGGILVL